MKMIPRTKIETSYIEILRSWKNEVEEIQKIEDFFKKKLRVDKVFLTSSARYGFLRLLLYLKNVKKAKKVIFPSYTTPIMPRQAIKVDLNISFERINKNDFCLLTKKNYEDSIIVATHIHGNPVKIDELKSKNCIIVEDCAHSLFSKYKNRPTGSFGDFGIFSISPTKLPFPLRFGFVTINDFNKKIEKFFEPKISNSTFPKAIFIGRTIFLKVIASRHIFDLLTYRFLKILSKKKDKLESLLFEDIGQKRIEKLIGIPNLEIIKKCWKRTKKMLEKREYYKKIYEKKLSDTFKFQKKTECSKV
ncbi:MAG: DegT/DnrJ/EryC1/StrS family aminotransferase, partial [Candidatus Aenigmarchaeota archaeon]|nr:DegT/DnrJ/EryC1/StrS family aminotransferase [Candidatus Aenigmarchaeota archaeon]